MNEVTKICNSCNKEKTLENFCRNKAKKYGHDSTCKECKKLYDKKYNKKNGKKRKEYWKNNKSELTAKHKVYLQNNKDNIIKQRQCYYKINKEEIIAKTKSYFQKNKKARNEYAKTYRKRRKEKDAVYKLSLNIRASINQSLKERDFRKKCKASEILGCSFQDFKIYIESKWKSWMNWKNHGLYNGELNYGWDLDHIIPLDTAKTEEDILKLNHYTNFQPLCSYTNRYIKRNKL